METVRLRRLNRWQAEGLREDLADLYVESSRAESGEEYRGREAFLRRLTGDIRRPGFALLIAEDTAFVGCAFGFPVRREGTWWRGFDGTLPQSIEQLTVSGHVFAITEIVVHPHAQNQDLARRLQQRLLADQHASLGATLVDQADSASLDAFLFWGWQDIGEVRRPSGPAVLRALVLPLGPRTAARPDGLGHDNRTQRHD
ncbi:GNAT family N-acetyltransferase [Streptomyces montanus]|uniref:GNAT family N-acetyltransferase n=1 Tax=Streptomyces montanus TaxID=2580423 RepID=UPI001FEB6866|nr:GNAT family N-acetyltransferase [Streptomyces montanus]